MENGHGAGSVPCSSCTCSRADPAGPVGPVGGIPRSRHTCSCSGAGPAGSIPRSRRTCTRCSDADPARSIPRAIPYTAADAAGIVAALTAKMLAKALHLGNCGHHVCWWALGTTSGDN